jgi:hypothetical protein
MLEPLHASAVSQTSRAARHSVPAASGPAATHVGPVHSNIPTSQRFVVAHGAPSVHIVTHMPRPSQVPPGQVVVEGLNTSGGHVGSVPSQLSATSHAPAAGRQAAPLIAS